MRDAFRSRLLDWPLTFIDRTKRHQHLLLGALCICIVIATIGEILEEGAWTRQLTLEGPFPFASGTSVVHVAKINDEAPLGLRIRIDQSQSTLPGTLPNPRLL